MTRPTRDDLAVTAITDLWGEAWLVAEYRETAHDFPIALGWPLLTDGPGNPRVIMTAELAEYLTATERLRDVDLPVGRTTIKRLRSELELSFDWDRWWSARSDDLHSMTLEAFCARHRCSMGAASQRRRTMGAG